MSGRKRRVCGEGEATERVRAALDAAESVLARLSEARETVAEVLAEAPAEGDAPERVEGAWG